MNEPKVSIIVTNFKHRSDLELSLNALLQMNYRNFEIVVVDSCTPNFNEWIKEKYPTLKSIHFCDDIGTAGLRNAGFQHIDSRSEYVCFIDDDVIVTSGWLDCIIKLMENCRGIGAVQPIRFNYNNKSEIDGLGYLMTRTAFPYRVETTKENLSKLRSIKVMDIFYAETTVMVVRHEILLRLGNNNLTPFDAEHFYAWDDVDLSWRIWLLGYRVVVTSESVCYHKRDINSRKAKLYNSRYIYYHTRGRFISILKNYELSYLFTYFPIAIIIEVCKSIALVYYKPDHAIKTFKGITWGLIHFRYMMKKRSESRRHIIRKNSELDAVFVKTSLLELFKQFKHNWY